MDIKGVKLELMQHLLQTESEALLTKLQNIFKQYEDFELSSDQKKMLDSRKDRNLNNEGRSFTWEEVKANARKAAG